MGDTKVIPEACVSPGLDGTVKVNEFGHVDPHTPINRMLQEGAEGAAIGSPLLLAGKVGVVADAFVATGFGVEGYLKGRHQLAEDIKCRSALRTLGMPVEETTIGILPPEKATPKVSATPPHVANPPKP